MNPHKADVVEAIREMTGGRGANVCIDTVCFGRECSFMDKVKATLNFEKGSIKSLMKKKEDCVKVVLNPKHFTTPIT